MANYDGTDDFEGVVTADQLNKTVTWRGTALPVGAANKIPQNGIFLLVDSLSTPTVYDFYIQTSATISSPNFKLLPRPSIGSVTAAFNNTLADYSIPTTLTEDLPTVSSANWTTIPNAIDRNTGTFSQHSLSAGTGTWYDIIVDFGSIRSRYLHYRNSFNSPSDGNGTMEVAYSSNGSSYTTFGTHVYTTTGEIFYTGVSSLVSCRYMRTRIRRDSGPSSLTGKTYEMFQSTDSTYTGTIHPIANGKDDNTTTTLYGENLILDLGSVKFVSHLGIYHESAPSDLATSYEIWVGDTDDGITFDTKIRTILTSALTDEAWNYIRFNTVNKRYIKLVPIGGLYSLDEIKYKEEIDYLSHEHFTISPTDSSLGLDGT